MSSSSSSSSSRMTLDAFISERLGAAASNIRVEVTELLAPLAEQNHQSRKELERLNRLLASVQPNLKLDGTDAMHHHHHQNPMCDMAAMSRSPRLTEEGRSPSLVKEEPQHRQLKEEPHHHHYYPQHTPMEAESSAQLE